MKNNSILFVFTFIFFLPTILKSQVVTPSLGVGDISLSEVFRPITLKSDTASWLRLDDSYGTDSTAICGLEFYRLNGVEQMGYLAYPNTMNGNLYLSNFTDNGWLEFQTHGLTKNMIDPNGWFHLGAGIRMANDSTSFISATGTGANSIYFNHNNFLAFSDLPAVGNLDNIAGVLCQNQLETVVKIPLNDLLRNELSTAPVYDSTADAAADTNLNEGVIFKVPNGDGTSSLHIKD